MAFVLGAVATLVLGGALAVPLAADAIATRMAEANLASHGLSCPGLALDASWDLSRAEIAPVRCVGAEGERSEAREVEALELVDPAFVDLVLFEPTHVRMGRVRVHLRADDAGTGVDLGALGPVAALLRIPSRIGSATRAAAEIAAHALPPLEASSVEIVRGASVRVSMTDVALGGGTPMTFTVARMDLPALEGPLGTSASVALNAVTGEATPATCSVRGELQIDAGVPLVGEVHRRTNASIIASGLDGARPSWDVSFD